MRAAEDSEGHVKEVTTVERERHLFSEKGVTLPEVLNVHEEADVWEDNEENRKRRWAAWKAAKAKKAAGRIEEKLNLTTRKKKYAEDQLAKLDKRMKLADAPPDKEQITDEERYMFQKLGLRMRAKLLLGRRGVFDGTVENMHLHWKYRELVKLIYKGPLFEAERTAKILEVESGGVLVGITTTSKGHTILFYRGKNYERPRELRPRHLLSKRQAMQRSLEMQRKRDLERHALRLEKEIRKLQVDLDETAEVDSGLERQGSSVLSALEPPGTKLEDFDDTGLDAYAEYNEDATDSTQDFVSRNETPNPSIIILDPIFKAQPLTIKERIRLRQEALKQCDPMHINIGKSNMVTGLAKSIRLYFQKHPFAIVGVKGRAKGTPVEEIIRQIEEATGAVLVSREPNKLIIYRGWAAGERRPDLAPEDEHEEEVSPDLRAAIMSEEIRNPMDFSYLTREECALVGIEYRGHETEENDESEQEDNVSCELDIWNDGKQNTGNSDDDRVTEVGVNTWNEEEKWYAENEDEGFAGAGRNLDFEAGGN